MIRRLLRNYPWTVALAAAALAITVGSMLFRAQAVTPYGMFTSCYGVQSRHGYLRVGWWNKGYISDPALGAEFNPWLPGNWWHVSVGVRQSNGARFVQFPAYFLLFPVLIALSLERARNRRKRAAGVCPACGYRMGALAVCVECGCAVSSGPNAGS